MTDDREVDASAGRIGVLFPPAIVLVATTISDGPVSLIVGLLGAATLVASAWLLGEGLRAEAAYNARRVARRGRKSSKAFGGLTITGKAVQHLNPLFYVEHKYRQGRPA